MPIRWGLRRSSRSSRSMKPSTDCAFKPSAAHSQTRASTGRKFYPESHIVMSESDSASLAKSLDHLGRASLFEIQEELAFSESDHAAFDSGSRRRRDGDDHRAFGDGRLRSEPQEKADVLGSSRADHAETRNAGILPRVCSEGRLDTERDSRIAANGSLDLLHRSRLSGRSSAPRRS